PLPRAALASNEQGQAVHSIAIGAFNHGPTLGRVQLELKGQRFHYRRSARFTLGGRWLRRVPLVGRWLVENICDRWMRRIPGVGQFSLWRGVPAGERPAKVDLREWWGSTTYQAEIKGGIYSAIVHVNGLDARFSIMMVRN